MLRNVSDGQKYSKRFILFLHNSKFDSFLQSIFRESITKMVTPFDNKKWVKDNQEYLYPNDPNETFHFVTLKHPYWGCAFNPSQSPPKFTEKTTLEELSLYADAVTICCVEVVGDKMVDKSARFVYEELHHLYP